MNRMRKRRYRKSGGARKQKLRRYRRNGTLRGRRAPRRRAALPAADRSPPNAALGQRAFDAGREAALDPGDEADAAPLKRLNGRWCDWATANGVAGLKWGAYHDIAGRFAAGFQSAIGARLHRPALVPTRKTIGAVVTAMNEEKAIPGVLEQLARLPLDETVVVVNGSADQTFWSTRNLSGGIVVHVMRPLGHDVGRALGAKLLRTDIVLFLDGDFPIYAEHLVPFLYAVDRGADVALNDITPFIDVFSSRDPVTIVKELLNRALGRSDLAANSMTAVPHALSRKAIETIGCPNLIVPPKAQALAIRRGLRVETAGSVDVISKNRVRDKNSGRDNPVSHLIVGDHLEALGQLMSLEGARLTAADTIRNRSVLGRVPS